MAGGGLEAELGWSPEKNVPSMLRTPRGSCAQEAPLPPGTPALSWCAMRRPCTSDRSGGFSTQVEGLEPHHYKVWEGRSRWVCAPFYWAVICARVGVL